MGELRLPRPGRAGRLIAISLMLVSLLTACGGRELADVTLIRVLGVDGAGPLELTALGDGEEDAVYRTVGDDLPAAEAGLNELGTTRLEVTHVGQLVLGPDADAGQILYQAVTDRKSGYGATVWLCREGLSAAALLEGAQAPSARLEALQENGGAGAPTVLEALSTLSRTGRVSLPVVALERGEVCLAGRATVEEG